MLKTKIGLAVMTAALLAASAGAATAQVGRERLLGEGRRIAERNCAQCHAATATGESPIAGAPKLRELGERYPFPAFAEALRRGLLTDHPAMPELRLTPAEIEALVAYLDSLQTRQLTQLTRP